MSAFEYPHAAERRQPPAHQRNAKRNRILIVEDNPISLTLLKQLLKAHGYEVLGTPEGLQALDLAREEQPDLILMDIRLPDISGFEVTRLLKQDQRTKTIPIVAVTALAGQVRWLLDKCGWGAVVAGALRAAKSSSMSSRTALS